MLDSRQNYTISTTKNSIFCKLILGALRVISVHLLPRASLFLYLSQLLSQVSGGAPPTLIDRRWATET